MTKPRPSPGDAASPPEWPRRNRRRLIGSLVGMALLAAAVWVVIRGGADLRRATEAVRSAPSWLLLLAVLLPLGNWLLVSMSFWVQMRRHGRIGPGEMCAVIGSAWLLNYLPLRPGMIGRLAYHKAVNKISLTDSVRVMIVNLACSLVAAGLLLAVAVAMPGGAGAWAWAAALLSLPLACAAASVLMAGTGRWWLPATMALRAADVLVWVARYWVVFRLAGAPLGLAESVAVAGVCQITLNVPLVGNGLGIREWAVGLTAANLPPGLFDQSGKVAFGAALTADLINRAAEVLVAVPVGLISAAMLAARSRKAVDAPSPA